LLARRAFCGGGRFDREQDVGGLGAAVGDHRIIRRALEIGIVEIDVRIAVAGGGDVHEPPARRDQCRDTIDQHEMAEMIGAELRLETFRGVAKGRSHNACIGDHGVERPAIGNKRVCAGADALKRGEIQLDQLEAAVRGQGADLVRGALGLGAIAHRADHLRPVRCQRPRGLDAKSGRYAGDQNAFSAEIDPRQHFISGGNRPEAFGHDKFLYRWAKLSPRR
jgi:hypothetical protein